MKIKRNHKALFGVVFLGMCIGMATGCGYTNKTVLPKNIKTIYVPTVQDKIPVGDVYAYQPGLAIDVTNAIVRRIERDGNLKIEAKDQADAILDAKLISFFQGGVRFNTLERVQEYRLYITLAVRLIDRKSNTVIWEEPNFTGDAEYVVSDVSTVSREEASQRAMERLAKNVVDRIVEDW